MLLSGTSEDISGDIFDCIIEENCPNHPLSQLSKQINGFKGAEESSALKSVDSVFLPLSKLRLRIGYLSFKTVRD